MTVNGKHSRSVQTRAGADNLKAEQFFRRTATQRPGRNAKLNALGNTKTETRLRTLLQDIGLNQSQGEATRDAMVVEASIDEVVPPMLVSVKGEQNLKAELERASWLLRSNELQLAEALREVDSLDKVLAWARRCQGDKSCNQHAIGAHLIAMLKEYQAGKRRKGVSKSAGASAEVEVDDTSPCLDEGMELKAALLAAEESADRKEAALALALARADQQLAGISQSGERLASDLVARDSEVKRLRADLAERETEIANISELLEEAQEKQSSGRVRSSSRRDTVRRNTYDAAVGVPATQSDRLSVPFFDPVQKRDISPPAAEYINQQFDGAQSCRESSKTKDGRHAWISDGHVRLKPTRAVRSKNADNGGYLLLPPVAMEDAEIGLACSPARRLDDHMNEDNVAQLSQSARQRSLKLDGVNRRQQRKNWSTTVDSAPRHQQDTNIKQEHKQRPTSSPRAQSPLSPPSAKSSSSSRCRRATSGGDTAQTVEAQQQRSSPPSSPRAWRAPGCLDGIDSVSNRPVPAPAPKPTGSKPPSGLSYIGMIQELAEALEGDGEVSSVRSGSAGSRRRETAPELPSVGNVTLESMFHLGTENGTDNRCGEESSTASQKSRKHVTLRPGNSYSEIFVAKREAQARLAKLQRDYGAARHLQSRRTVSQTSSRATTPRRHTADTPVSRRNLAGAARPTADDIVTPMEARRLSFKSFALTDETIHRSPSTPDGVPSSVPSRPAAADGYTSDASGESSFAFTPRRLRFSGEYHRRSQCASELKFDTQPCAGLLFAGNLWYSAVFAAAAASHPSPGGAAVTLLARWGAVSEEQPKNKGNRDAGGGTSTTVGLSMPSPRHHRRTVSASAAMPTSQTEAASAESNNASTEKPSTADLVTSESSSTMDSLYKLIHNVSKPSGGLRSYNEHVDGESHVLHNGMGKEGASEWAATCEGNDMENGCHSSTSSPRTMGYYVGEDGILHYSSPRSTLDDLPSPRHRSPRAVSSDSERPTWRPQLRPFSHHNSHCAALSNAKMSIPLETMELSHPLSERFAQWKRACGWSNLAAVVLHEVRRSRQEIHSVSKAELAALRSFTRPPPAVQRTLEALAIILSDGQLPQRWVNVLSLLRSESLKAELLAFEPKSIAPKAVRFLQTRYLNHPNFTFVEVARASHALGPLLRWIKAVVNYGAYRHLWHGQIDLSLSSVNSTNVSSSAPSFLRSSSEASEAGEAVGSASTDELREKQLDRWRTALAYTQSTPLISPRAAPLWHEYPQHAKERQQPNRKRAPHVVKMGVPSMMMAAY